MDAHKQLSRRHHFVPKFYLETWHQADGLGVWLYYRNKNGGLSLRRRSAKSVGFTDNLYLLKADGLPFSKDSDDLERRFFGTIDSSASLVHKKFLSSGINTLSSDDKVTWAVFMNSLIERSPDRINSFENASDDVFDKAFLKFQEQWGASDSWPKIKTLLESQNKNIAIRNAVLTGLIQYIIDKPFIQYLSQMVWQTVGLPEGLDHFVTSDIPVVINSGSEREPIYIMSIALSPTLLLIMHKDVQEFDQEVIIKLAMLHNYFMAKLAKKYLISSRELKDGRFIKHLQIAETVFDKNYNFD